MLSSRERLLCVIHRLSEWSLLKKQSLGEKREKRTKKPSCEVLRPALLKVDGSLGSLDSSAAAAAYISVNKSAEPQG